ncbi:hypothetical protein VTO73DRAFT_8027 [Trametes versicolor]
MRRRGNIRRAEHDPESALGVRVPEDTKQDDAPPVQVRVLEIRQRSPAILGTAAGMQLEALEGQAVHMQRRKNKSSRTETSAAHGKRLRLSHTGPCAGTRCVRQTPQPCAVLRRFTYRQRRIVCAGGPHTDPRRRFQESCPFSAPMQPLLSKIDTGVRTIRRE